MNIKYTNKCTSKPRRQHSSNKIQPKLDEFMARSETYMCLTYEESDGYKSVFSMYASFRNAVRRSGYAIRIWKEKDQVWFEKIVSTESP